MTWVLSVRVLTPDDWSLWRALRLASLTEAPGVFGSTLAQWSGSGDTERRWRDRLSSVALNLAIVADGDPIAMVSATTPDRSGEVELISLWVAPAWRGRNAGDEAVRQVVAWARDRHPGHPVVLSVKADNQHARRLYERHGFVDAGPSRDDDERQMRRPA